MRLFIYGTLKRGCYNHYYMDGQHFVGTARTEPCYRLFNLGGFPGMVSASDGLSIEGEVWDIDDACRARLDVLEGVAEDEYILEPVPLLAPFDREIVHGYRYLRSVVSRPEIGSVWKEK
jgi:gamma-glutamylaminecyclotransferase